MECKYKVGQQIGNFKIQKVVAIEELQSTLYECIHIPSQARVMQIANTDRENLFSLSFKTHPLDSKGTAHILEHTVLCGSEKFPVKDPFFCMTRRSLNTFMNALTGSDFTCYPAASQIPADFYNLLEVYLDAVFHPKLQHLSFLQEGHRLSFKEADNPDSDLIFQGVVFNEMKGSLSSPETRLWHTLSKHLMPDLPYTHNSGGDPQNIPDLTYQELLDFHATYYHPSRCLFFFYGDLPLQKNLEFIDQHILGKVSSAKQPISPIKPQKRFTKPLRLVATYPLNEEKDQGKSFFSIAWLTAPIQNQEELLALFVIDAVLMDNDASLLKQPLLQSALCAQAYSVLETDMSEIPYAIVCRGTEKTHGEKLENLVFHTLNNILKTGIDKPLVDAAIHQLELSRTEISSDFGPFGLNLFMKCALAAQHGCNGEDALSIHTQFAKLRKNVENPDYLPKIMRKYLIDNPHFVSLTFIPDKQQTEKEKQCEEEKLKKLQNTLSKKDKETILEQTKKLAQFQQKKESIDCLPKLKISQVPRKGIDYPLHQEQINNLELFHHDCFTNHILYANVIFPLPQLTVEELPYAKLLCTLLTELGTKNRSYNEVLQDMHLYTGGIQAHLSLGLHLDGEERARPTFCLHGSALHRNTEKLFSLMSAFLQNSRFDEEKRIQQLLLQIHTSLQHKLQSSPLPFAATLALSSLSKASAIQEHFKGLTYFNFIHQLLETDISTVIDKLSALKTRLFHLNHPHLVLSGDKSIYNTVKTHQAFGLANLPTSDLSPWSFPQIEGNANSQGRLITSPVAFIASGYPSINAKHPDAPGLCLALEILKNTSLHKMIREQGGAYGSGTNYHPTLGHLIFFSYRDPHIQLTFKAFQTAIQKGADGVFTQADIEEAQLGVIQDLDAPTTPGERAMHSYDLLQSGNTLALRQEFRDKVLSITPETIQKAVQNHLLPYIGKSVDVVFANQDLFAKENSSLPLFDPLFKDYDCKNERPVLS